MPVKFIGLTKRELLGGSKPTDRKESVRYLADPVAGVLVEELLKHPMLRRLSFILGIKGDLGSSSLRIWKSSEHGAPASSRSWKPPEGFAACVGCGCELHALTKTIISTNAIRSFFIFQLAHTKHPFYIIRLVPPKSITLSRASTPHHHRGMGCNVCLSLVQWASPRA
jgi:hypothetical protein